MAPTRQQAKDILWQHLKERFGQLGWSANINESELRIQRKNKAIILIRSAEKPDRLRGLGIDFIILDEMAEYRDKNLWSQVVRPALSDKRGKALICGTPKGFNYFHTLYQQAKTEDNWSAYQFKTVDSPFFQTPEGLQELEDARNSLSEKDFKQEYEASFETHTGRIYYSFNREYNHVDYNYDPTLPVYLGQDFNRSPMSSALFQMVAGRLIQFDEVFIRSGDTEGTCTAIQKKYPKAKITFRPDATGSRRTSNSSISDFQIIKEYGFTIESDKLNPRRIDRWAAINRAYEKKLVMINVKNCPVTVKDRETLIYKEGTCEPDLRDPFMGHMSDAADYCIYRDFPIFKRVKPRYGGY